MDLLIIYVSLIEDDVIMIGNIDWDSWNKGHTRRLKYKIRLVVIAARRGKGEAA